MHRDFIYPTSDISFLTEVPETGHCNEHCLDVRAPQEHVQGDFQFCLGLATDGSSTAACCAFLGKQRIQDLVILLMNMAP